MASPLPPPPPDPDERRTGCRRTLGCGCFGCTGLVFLDGIVYGSLVGIGFAMTENVLYFGREYVQDGLVGVGLLFYFRVVLGGLGHALYTGTTGAALGYAREIQHRWLGLLLVPLGYV